MKQQTPLRNKKPQSIYVQHMNENEDNECANLISCKRLLNLLRCGLEWV